MLLSELRKSILILAMILKNDIHQMSELVAASLHDVLIAFKTNNANLAGEIPGRDLKIDAIYSSLMIRLEKNMVDYPNHITSNVQIIFAIKNIERIGDYVTKIARITYFIVTGDRNI